VRVKFRHLDSLPAPLRGRSHPPTVALCQSRRDRGPNSSTWPSPRCSRTVLQPELPRADDQQLQLAEAVNTIGCLLVQIHGNRLLGLAQGAFRGCGGRSDVEPTMLLVSRLQAISDRRPLDR